MGKLDFLKYPPNPIGVIYLAHVWLKYCNTSPASIRTPIFEKFGSDSFSLEEVVRMSAKYYPIGRIGESSDCAKAVAYLASDDAAFISGALLPVDGGSLFGNMTNPDDN